MSLVLTALKSIDPDDPGNQFGICTVLKRKLFCLGVPAEEAHNRAYTYVAEIAPLWPEFSGDLSYPVPSPDTNFTAGDFYYNTMDRWAKDEPYGAARRRLLAFVIRATELKIWMRDTLRNIPPDYTSKFGICAYLRDVEPPNLPVEDWRLYKSIFQELCKSWNYFTGDVAYPVPDLFLTPRQAYHKSPIATRWSKTHPYGQARWQLIDHMIKELSNAVA